MVLEYRFVCPLNSGVHARPASSIEEAASPFQAKITLINERNGKRSNAKSVLSMVAADIRIDDPCLLQVQGDDANAAFAAMQRFLEEELHHCDAPLPIFEPPSGEVHLPPCLRSIALEYLPGHALVPGIGRGRAVIVGRLDLPESLGNGGRIDPAAERNKLESGLGALKERLLDRLAAPLPEVEAGIVRAQFAVARDVELRRKLEALVAFGNCSAAGAIVGAAKHFSNILAASGSAVLEERILDVQDICSQLAGIIYGDDIVRPPEIVLSGPAVCVAEQLTPSQFLALDRRYLQGLVLANGGPSSHTVILARSYGIPTLVGVAHAAQQVRPGREVVVDGGLGFLVTVLSVAAASYYDREQDKITRRRARLREGAASPAVTRDGQVIEVAANAALVEDAKAAADSGADGIGLFRTEMLFMDRESPPSEEEQLAAYRGVLDAAGGRPVTIRTFDIGGDKPLPYLPLPIESNPFLGRRAVRLYPDLPDLFDTHLRAILRAAETGTDTGTEAGGDDRADSDGSDHVERDQDFQDRPMKIMVPMVATVEEMRWVRERIDALRRTEKQRSALQLRPRPPIEVGMMLEVPSAAFILDQLCRVADFFSIGSNDLAQYFLAADRQNNRVARLAGHIHPSFVRLLKKIVDEVHAHGKWVGLCGEMAGVPAYLPLWIGLGLDEISLAPRVIPQIKAAVRELDVPACRALVERIMDLESSDAVKDVLHRFQRRKQELPLLDPTLVFLDSQSRTKEEAIKELADALFVSGRTSEPGEVEEAVWRREEIYSTGLGHGFAIPHCKSENVTADSLAVLRLANPIPWKSVDEKPVDTVILLAIRGSHEDSGGNEPAGNRSGESSEGDNAHMQIFSRLARALMHEEFRAGLRVATTSEALQDFLRTTLDC